MIRYFSRLIILAGILTIAMMISPAAAQTPAGDISTSAGLLSPDLLKVSGDSGITGLSTDYSTSGDGFPPEFRWAVPAEVGVHAFSIAIDDKDNVYATDPINHSIRKFTPDGSRLSQWGSAGTGPGEFTAPIGVAVNRSGYAYITDVNRVHVFDPDGDFVTAWGSAGNNTGEFSSLIGIAVNSSGYVYTSETRTNRIQVFDPEGTFLTTWGTTGSGPGEFNGPMSIAVNGSGFVFVAEQFNNRVQVFDPSGGFVQSWNKSDGGYGSGNGEFSFPQTIAVSGNGYVYVGDAGNHRVQVFDQAGEYVRQFPASVGLGIAVNSSGYVYLTDYSYDRIQVFDPSGAYVSMWGARGDGEGMFFHPYGVAVNASGYSFVTDSENYRVQIFSPAGDFAGQWGSQGSGNGQFLLPLGIAVNDSGYVYVADSGNNRVQVIDPYGAFTTRWGSPGSGAGQLLDPRGIAVNSSGFVYVAETANARIQIFTNDGVSLGYWGSQGSGDGQFSGPMGIAINRSGFVFVTDNSNNRVQVFDPSGVYIMQIGSYGSGDGMLYSPMGVAVDAGGRVLVADSGNHRVQVFDEYGGYAGQWGSQGTNTGQFYVPAGIAADSQGNVFVVELYNDRIQKFAFPGSEPLPVEITIGPGTPGIIASTIASVPDGSTIILDPGTYYEHDIVVAHDVTIRANTSAGGSAANTIIDAEFAGRILDNSANHDLAIDNLSFIHGYAMYGGAINIANSDINATRPSVITITSSSISNCTASYDGGAILAYSTLPCCMPAPNITILSTDISGCRALRGGAIFVNGANVSMRFSRIYHDTGNPVEFWYNTFDAPDNWWGTNSDPSGLVTGSGTMITSPWLVLDLSATPSSIMIGNTSVIQVNLTRNSAGEDTSSGGIFVPDGIAVAYVSAGSSGILLPPEGNISSGRNMTTFEPAEAGTGVIAVSVDSQTVFANITVTAPEEPVIANFTSDVTTGLVPLVVLFTDNSTGEPVSWNWSFGDGSYSDDQSPAHIYTVSGNYTVNLTVANAGGTASTLSMPAYIRAQSLPAPDFSAWPQSGDAPLAVQFTGYSDGSPLNWSWSFGDGNSAGGRNVSHTYLTPGVYTVSLTVVYPNGINTTSQADLINVTEPVEPVIASFTSSTTTGKVPLAVKFTDQSTGSPTSWAWSFGDGTNSTLRNPEHTYTAAGNYTVALTVTGAAGSNTTVRPAYIHATAGTKPVAAFTANKTSGKRPLTVKFTDQSTGSPTSWAWNFGDGATSTLRNPSHTYTKLGVYTVSLTAANDQGSDKKTRSYYIWVTPW